MADLTRQEMQRLARLGAKSRLEELQREVAAIRRAFPDLARGQQGGGRRGRPPASESSAGEEAASGGRGGRRRRRRQRTMSAADRKAVSDRMKRYWAARRKASAK